MTTTRRIGTLMICALLLLCAAVPAAVSAQAVNQPPPSGTPETDATVAAGVAAGAVEDTLRACMARIPKDASIGQRMIAEQSCGRDESDRKPFQAVPGARSMRH